MAAGSVPCFDRRICVFENTCIHLRSKPIASSRCQLRGSQVWKDMEGHGRPWKDTRKVCKFDRKILKVASTGSCFVSLCSVIPCAAACCCLLLPAVICRYLRNQGCTKTWPVIQVRNLSRLMIAQDPAPNASSEPDLIHDACWTHASRFSFLKGGLSSFGFYLHSNTFHPLLTKSID